MSLQNDAGDIGDNSKTLENTDKEMECTESRQFRGAGSWKKRKFVSVSCKPLVSFKAYCFTTDTNVQQIYVIKLLADGL